MTSMKAEDPAPRNSDVEASFHSADETPEVQLDAQAHRYDHHAETKDPTHWDDKAGIVKDARAAGVEQTHAIYDAGLEHPHDVHQNANIEMFHIQGPSLDLETSLARPWSSSVDAVVRLRTMDLTGCHCSLEDHWSNCRRAFVAALWLSLGQGWDLAVE